MEKARAREASDALVHLLDDQVDDKTARREIERSEELNVRSALNLAECPTPSSVGWDTKL